MTPAELDDARRNEILHREILPLFFSDPPASDMPTLVLVAGQPGAGRSRAMSALRRDGEPGVAVVNGEEMRAFHPAFLEQRSHGEDPELAATVARDVAGLVSACIRYAREHHRSLVLEGSFANVDAAAGTARRFAAEGFATRLVVVGSGRAESLLSVTSHYLRDLQAGRPATLTSRRAHDNGLAATRVLVASVEESLWADRVTILSRDGRAVFDADRSDGASGFAGAGSALVAAQSERMGRFDATHWLSELHHVTDFASTRRGLPPEVAELLVDLHETSLREVIPELHVPTAGKFATAIEQQTVARLVALRQTLTRAPAADVAAPVVVPGGPERGGSVSVSRLVGYARELSPGAGTAAAEAELARAGVERVFTDTRATDPRKRPALTECLDLLEEGDVLLVPSGSHLSHAVTHFVATVDALTARGIRFRSLTEPALSTEAGRTVNPAEVLEALEALRRRLVSLRTRAGMASAAASGKRPGRPRVMTPEKVAMAVELRRLGRPVTHIARVLGVSANSVQRALDQLPHDH